MILPIFTDYMGDIFPGSLGSEKKPIAVASRCSVNHVGTALAGTVAGVTYRYAHTMKTEAYSLQLVFANFYPTVTTESSNANAITIAVTIEYGGLVQRLHFNGKRTVTLDQGGIAITDPFWRDIPVGATFYTKTWVSVPVDANTYPQGLSLVQSLGEGRGIGDLTLNAGALTNSTEVGFGPAVIIGVPVKDDSVAFALIGDSMIGDANGDGFPVMAIQGKYGYSLLSRPGSDVTTMQQNSGNAYRLRLAKYFTHAIVTFGANDFNLAANFATQEGHMKNLWRSLQSMGLTVYQTTTTPRSTSTDGWATIPNQNVYSGNSYNAKRATFNQNLRNGLYPVRVIDAASVVETASDASGVWKVSYTGDGIHPVLAAKNAIVAKTNLGL